MRNHKNTLKALVGVMTTSFVIGIGSSALTSNLYESNLLVNWERIEEENIPTTKIKWKDKVQKKGKFETNKRKENIPLLKEPDQKKGKSETNKSKENFFPLKQPVQIKTISSNLTILNDNLNVVIKGTSTTPRHIKSEFDKQSKSWSIYFSVDDVKSDINLIKSWSIPEAGIGSIAIQKDIKKDIYKINILPLAGININAPREIINGNNLTIYFERPFKNNFQVGNSDLSKNKLPINKSFADKMTIKNKGFINIPGPDITLVLKDANAKDLLMSLAKIGGYGFIYVPDLNSQSSSSQDSNKIREVTISFNKESYSKVINSVLLASGWEGKKEGKILLVGENILSKTFGEEISKVFRMKQASAASAADYLASLGAVISKVYLTNVGSNEKGSVEQSVNKDTSVKSYGASQGPLKGLIGTTDSRLETITLIGESQLIDIAEKYINLIDQPLKQVALSVKILDVNLDKSDEFDNSFAKKINKTFILSDSGVVDAVFGNIQAWDTGRSTGVAAVDIDTASNFDFLDWLKMKISSSSTKVLASPTLILSESKDSVSGGGAIAAGSTDGFTSATIGRPFGNESFITVGKKVITSYEVTAGENGAPASCEASFGTSGLTFGAKIHKIDDNGYVTFSMSPELSAATSTIDTGTCGTVSVLSIRRLDSGTVRVKNKSTLILTGVISDTDSEVISKWPIVGDIPILGNFFKSSKLDKKKSELIIMVTPQIINDDQTIYAYNSVD